MIRFLITKDMAQRPITSFFKPQESNKRKLSEKQSNNSDNQLPKQQKRSEQQVICADFTEAIRKQSLLTPALSDNIGHSWFKALRPEFSKDYFKRLSTFLEEERKSFIVYPPPQQIYSWTLMTDITDIKVVILGQDPYHGPNQAHGLSFSVRKGVSPPPSLINIFKELETDILDFKRPTHGDLTGWGKQGVLLLNACLTVRANKPNSHSNNGWENLTDAVIKWLNNNLVGVVFMLWGSYAQKKGGFINRKTHLVLQSAHPSPFSALRGFFGCKHFSSANDYLMKNGKKAIDWSNLP